MSVTLARTAADHAAVLMNYMRVVALRKERGMVSGVTAVDEETGRSYELRASHSRRPHESLTSSLQNSGVITDG